MSTMTKILTHSGLTLTHQDLDDFITEKTARRNDKNRHVLFTNFPDIRQIRERLFWGIYSWTIPSQKSRYLLKRDTLNARGMYLSPADVVRDYLDFYYPRSLRATGIEVREYERRRSAPLYVRPTTIREAVYIDIKSTYFSIVLNIGWDINYMPGQWLTPGIAPLDFPLPKNKPARNYMVSIGLPGMMTIWDGQKLIYQKCRNIHINMGLWSLVQDVLHSIANYAVMNGACYVHTDGYILPLEKAGKLIEYIAGFGLTAEMRAEGEGYVFGFGNYLIGDKKTKSFNPSRVMTPKSNLYSVNGKWLQNTIARIIERRIPEQLYNRARNP